MKKGALAQLFDGFTADMHCTKNLAVDENGVGVWEGSLRAKRWCAIGWAWKKMAAGSVGIHACLDGMHQVAAGLGYKDVGEANDAMGYAFIQSIRGELQG